ncbi:MAG: sugar ABC transporter ATP-binding protein [Candidatus Atribacteria bacterium]|nr:sugar ABC transporter ATP-binding protein [Candidatus Atribacteria bacterium]
MSEEILRVENVTKKFPGVIALDKVSFNLRRGEVHALVGENGAGKSTLMKILSGVYQPDEGTIYLKGQPIVFHNPIEAQRAGISIIYQELNLMPHLTVAQNIFIGREPLKKGGRIDDKKMSEDAAAILSQLHVDIDTNIPVHLLPLSKRQMVEIAKALSYQAEVFIMDEPTSALTEAEIEELFKVIHRLRNRGVGIIYISHRLEELKDVADRVTVLRDGRYVSTDEYRSVTIDQIVSNMVGRSLEEKFPPRTSIPTDKKILEVRNINRAGVLHSISFDLYQGEILGMAGLVGAGRTELARAIFGADPKDEGEVFLFGEKVNISSPTDAIRAGIGYLPEDRKLAGLALEMLLIENITLANTEEVSNNLGVISNKKEKQVAEQYVKELDIRTPSVFQVVKNLSGGNQQKTVLAKWLFRKAKVLIFDEPTRGIDVGAKYAIHKLIDSLARSGVGVIMISSELPEILGMTDRILVLHEGRLVGILQTKETNQEEILNYAAGLASNASSKNRNNFIKEG